MPLPARSLPRRCVAEALGTFVLVLLGTGAVHAAVLAGAQSGLWQVAVVWAIAVALAIHATAGVSGAHINPAITLAFAAFGGFPARDVLPYWLGQLAGAFLAAALLFALWSPSLAAFEQREQLVRGAPGSERSAMCYGEYFPDPGRGTDARAFALVSEWQACLAEFAGTALLALAVFALTDPRNPVAPGHRLTPLLIGLTVAGLISVLAPITQGGFNPARDLGPRLLAWCAGWGDVAIPGPRGGFLTVYVLSPLAGALAGGALHRVLLAPAWRRRADD